MAAAVLVLAFSDVFSLHIEAYILICCLHDFMFCQKFDSLKSKIRQAYVCRLAKARKEVSYYN